MRTNEGYAIKNTIRIDDVEFVFGEHMTVPNRFVTWECKDGDNYYWGHYFDSCMPAVKDLLQRALASLSEEAKPAVKKPYFFCMTVCDMRVSFPIGCRCGVVLADCQESAEKIAWERFGGGNACKLWAQEVPEDGYDYTVFKSEII